MQARKASLTVLKKLVLAIIVLAAAAWLALNPMSLSNYALLYYYGLIFVVAVAFAVMLRGRWRDACVVVAALTVGLSAIELISIHAVARTVNMRQRGTFVANAALGWSLGKPGVYWQNKTEGGPHGHVIFDVNYTIDQHSNRLTVSAEHGPTVAFFGDSMTFGEGIPDDETLPQAFADLTGRKMHVLNLAVPGYGPEHFLRALELDLDHDLLKNDPRLFVFLTAPWHAERVSCGSSFTLLGPSYALESGKTVYKGFCYQQGAKVLSAITSALASTSTYQMFFKNVAPNVYRYEIDLYVAVLIRAGQLAREKYGVPTLVLYLTDWPDYVGQIGMTDQQVMQRLRDGGLQVIDASIDQKAYPGQPLRIPGDGHPTGLANNIRAKMVLQALENLSKDRAETRSAPESPVTAATP